MDVREFWLAFRRVRADEVALDACELGLAPKRRRVTAGELDCELVRELELARTWRRAAAGEFDGELVRELARDPVRERGRNEVEVGGDAR